MGVEHPDWLPEDWKIEVKTRSYGRRDKYYISPKSGLKFKSQPEVLRYLQVSEKPQIPVEAKQDDTKKVGIVKTVAANLPAGWIKEVRTTKKKDRKLRKDAYYIDPVSGHCFRSIPEVLRHLHSNETGKTKKQESRGQSSAKAKGRASANKRHYKNLASIMKSVENLADNVKNEDDDLQGSLNCVEQEANKTKKVMNRVRDELDMNAIMDRRLRSGSKASDSRTRDLVYVKRRSLEVQPVLANALDNLPQVNDKEHHTYGRRKSKRLHENKIKDADEHQLMHSGVELDLIQRYGRKERKTADVDRSLRLEYDDAIEGTVSRPLPDREVSYPARGGGASSMQKQVKRKKGKCFTNHEPHRSSKRLAVPKVVSSLEASCCDEDRGNEEKPEVEPAISSPGSLCDPENRNDTAEKNREITRNSELWSSVTVKDVPSSEGNKDAIDAATDKGNKQEKVSSLNDLLMDPCIEFAVKTLTGAIPIEDMKNVESRLLITSPPACSSTSTAPSNNIWSDPCFEFAVKTLTGEIPMDCGSKQFQQPLFPCSNNLNKVGSSNHSLEQQRIKDTTNIFNRSL